MVIKKRKQTQFYTQIVYWTRCMHMYVQGHGSTSCTHPHTNAQISLFIIVMYLNQIYLHTHIQVHLRYTTFITQTLRYLTFPKARIFIKKCIHIYRTHPQGAWFFWNAKVGDLTPWSGYIIPNHQGPSFHLEGANIQLEVDIDYKSHDSKKTPLPFYC